MSEKIENIKLIFAAITGCLTSLFGETSRLIFVLFVLICVDTIFGWIKALKNKTFKSNTARLGAMGKIVELMLIACLYLLDWVFNADILKYIGIYYFGICEISSILENYSQINGNLPEGLTDVLNYARKSVSKRIVEYFRKMFTEEKDDENSK